jgi:hypothetical protein
MAWEHDLRQVECNSTTVINMHMHSSPQYFGNLLNFWLTFLAEREKNEWFATGRVG